MHPETRHVAEHMKEFGLFMLGRSILDVTFSEMINPYGHAMGLVRCAHAAEIIIKARIAEEHPLLIFNKLPKPRADSVDYLDAGMLLRAGKTIMYSDLPDMLWAATGYQISDKARFASFGEFRNMIMHFAVPDGDIATETLSFAFEILEPMIFDFWQVDIYEYAGRYNDDCTQYIHEQLQELGIPILTR